MSKKGHILRTRSGHCCQCNTAIIDVQKRNDSAGIVYIAGTISGELVKIGFSKAVKVTAVSLNRTKYAGYNDWKILYALKSKDAGKIESKANSLLYEYAYSLDYEHGGHDQDSTETYHCAYSKAKGILEELCKNEYYTIEIEKNSPTKLYEFKNLRNL